MITLGSSMTLLALAAGFLSNNGEKVRMQVRHEGRPISVEIVGVGYDGQEVVVDAFPRRFITSPNRPRKVFIEYNKQEVEYLCAASNTKPSNGASLRFRSCMSVQFQPTRSSGSQESTLGGALRSRLQEALAAPQQPQIELQLD